MRDPDWSLGKYVGTEIRYADEKEEAAATGKGKGKGKVEKDNNKRRKSKFYPEDDDEVEEEWKLEEEEAAAAAGSATGRRIDQVIDRFEGCVVMLRWGVGVSVVDWAVLSPLGSYRGWTSYTTQPNQTQPST